MVRGRPVQRRHRGLDALRAGGGSARHVDHGRARRVSGADAPDGSGADSFRAFGADAEVVVTRLLRRPARRPGVGLSPRLPCPGWETCLEFPAGGTKRGERAQSADDLWSFRGGISFESPQAPPRARRSAAPGRCDWGRPCRAMSRPSPWAPGGSGALIPSSSISMGMATSISSRRPGSSSPPSICGWGTAKATSPRSSPPGPTSATPPLPRGTSTTTDSRTSWQGRRSRCRSEEHTSELQSLAYLVCRLLLEKKKKKQHNNRQYTPRHQSKNHGY